MAIPCCNVKIKGLNELPGDIARYDWLWWVFIERGAENRIIKFGQVCDKGNGREYFWKNINSQA
jgi:hypothetical protein